MRTACILTFFGAFSIAYLWLASSRATPKAGKPASPSSTMPSELRRSPDYEIDVKQSYTWYDNTRATIRQSYGSWGLATYLPKLTHGEGTVVRLDYSTHVVGSFDGNCSVRALIQMPPSINVGDRFGITLIGEERQPNFDDGKHPLLRLSDGECVVNRFANPSVVENQIDDGSVAITIVIRDINEERVVVDIELRDGVGYHGHSNYGVPGTVTLERRSPNAG